MVLKHILLFENCNFVQSSFLSFLTHLLCWCNYHGLITADSILNFKWALSTHIVHRASTVQNFLLILKKKKSSCGRSGVGTSELPLMPPGCRATGKVVAVSKGHHTTPSEGLTCGGFKNSISSSGGSIRIPVHSLVSSRRERKRKWEGGESDCVQSKSQVNLSTQLWEINSVKPWLLPFKV